MRIPCVRFLPTKLYCRTNYELFASDNVAGIDIDLYRNDWTYHTRLDGLDDYQSGTLQAMGENTLDYLVGYTCFFIKKVIIVK